MKKRPRWSLASISPFDALPIEEVGRVEHCSFEKHFQRGDRIFVEGSSAHTVWIVKEGRVHLEKDHSNGKVSTMCVRAEGDLLCCLPVLDRKDYHATAIAKEPSTLIGIPSEVFLELMARHPELARRVVTILCQCIRQAEEMAPSHAYESAEKRVVKVLLMMANKFGPEIPLQDKKLPNFPL